MKKSILILGFLIGLQAHATNIRDFIFSAVEIAAAHDTCIKNNPTNPGTIVCNKTAVENIQIALKFIEQSLNATNQGTDVHGRNEAEILKSIDAAHAAFVTYVQNECTIEVYARGGGTASDNLANFSDCEFRLQLERLKILEKLTP